MTNEVAKSSIGGGGIFAVDRGVGLTPGEFPFSNKRLSFLLTIRRLMAEREFLHQRPGRLETGMPFEAPLEYRPVGKSLGVKASGGIRSWDTAVGYLKQGCKRLGVASTEKVLDGAPE